MATTPAGAPIWIELYVPDLAPATTFYGELFGWRFNDMGEEYGHYTLVTLGDDVVAGAMAMDQGMPALCVYLATDDIRAVTARVREHGGQVLVEPMDIPGQGTMAFYADPTGAAIGAWQSPEVLLQARNSVGASVWYELMTSDYQAAKSFYAHVFGWRLVPMGEQGGPFQYATNGEGDDAVAGLCDASTFIPSEVPTSFWRVYLGVENTDAAIDKIKALGGELVDGPMDSPFGRLATVADDQGVMFQIIEA
ncbi:VOC family protein [Tessaracoccus lapidicaptus]|uniref:VOC family protein n=1 Tax=Tessaracoccus lapidicaptus TaxID=1427523 RepID=UPI00333F1592